MTPLQVALEREVIYRRIEQERQRAYQRSTRDSLSGLFTRVYMQDVVASQCGIDDRAEATELAAVMLDLDHFKQINDSHGHAAGDAVLRRYADILMRTARATDIPVRFGGEELIIFIVGAAALGLAQFAERLRRTIEEHAFDVGYRTPAAGDRKPRRRHPQGRREHGCGNPTRRRGPVHSQKQRPQPGTSSRGRANRLTTTGPAAGEQGRPAANTTTWHNPRDMLPNHASREPSPHANNIADAHPPHRSQQARQ